SPSARAIPSGCWPASSLAWGWRSVPSTSWAGFFRKTVRFARQRETAMTNTNPVYRSLNKPLTIWGAERRLVFVAALMGAGTFNFFGSLRSGLLMFVSLFIFARWATIHDPQILRILLNSARFNRQYDAGQCASGG